MLLVPADSEFMSHFLLNDLFKVYMQNIGKYTYVCMHITMKNNYLKRSVKNHTCRKSHIRQEMEIEKKKTKYSLKKIVQIY